MVGGKLAVGRQRRKARERGKMRKTLIDPKKMGVDQRSEEHQCYARAAYMPEVSTWPHPLSYSLCVGVDMEQSRSERKLR